MTESDAHTYQDRYMLRLPDGMRDRIKIAAANNNRSMNAEIVALLEEHYPAPPYVDIEEAIARVERTFAALNEWLPEGSKEREAYSESEALLEKLREGLLSPESETHQRFVALAAVAYADGFLGALSRARIK
jgi:plasmid stability protein